MRAVGNAYHSIWLNEERIGDYRPNGHVLFSGGQQMTTVNWASGLWAIELLDLTIRGDRGRDVSPQGFESDMLIRWEAAIRDFLGVRYVNERLIGFDVREVRYSDDATELQRVARERPDVETAQRLAREGREPLANQLYARRFIVNRDPSQPVLETPSSYIAEAMYMEQAERLERKRLATEEAVAHQEQRRQYGGIPIFDRRPNE